MPTSKSKMDLPVTHFGKVGKKSKEWREAQIDEIDDDDSELDETPVDVLKMLGFDPAEVRTITKHKKSHSAVSRINVIV